MIYSVVIISAACLLALNASPVTIKMPIEMIEKVTVVGNQCVEETGAPADSLANILPWNLSENGTNKKYLFCLCDNLNLLNDKGYFNFERTMKIFVNSDKKEDIEKSFHECNDLKAKDKYETTYKIVDCFFKKAPVSLSL